MSDSLTRPPPRVVDPPRLRTGQRRKLRRASIIAAAALAVAYGVMAATVATQQRSMLFNTRNDGQLAVAGSLAIPDSRRIALKSADNVQLAAWYVPPQPGHKVFLFLHGQGGRLSVQTGRWQRLRDSGHGVLALSYRGYPGSSGTPTEAGLHLDARAAYDWLLARHPKQDIVLHGHSLGSGVAVRLASGIEAHALVLEAPFSAAVDVAAERMPWFPVRLLMLDQFRSRDWIANTRAPLLIVHGERDTVIPITHAERLIALANEPKTLVRIPGGNHNSLVRDGLYGHVWAFLAKLR